MVELHNYPPANSFAQKIYNWQTLTKKVFKKVGLAMAKPEMEALSNAEPGAVEQLLKKLQVAVRAPAGEHARTKAEELPRALRTRSPARRGDAHAPSRARACPPPPFPPASRSSPSTTCERSSRRPPASTGAPAATPRGSGKAAGRRCRRSARRPTRSLRALIRCSCCRSATRPWTSWSRRSQSSRSRRAPACGPCRVLLSAHGRSGARRKPRLCRGEAAGASAPLDDDVPP